jgi:IS30 family transposase
MTYQHLSHHERYQIAALMKAGQNQTQIAAILGRHNSTVSREIHLNTGSGRNRGCSDHRPRKRLGFKTPHEVFHQSLNRIAVRI